MLVKIPTHSACSINRFGDLQNLRSSKYNPNHGHVAQYWDESKTPGRKGMNGMKTINLKNGRKTRSINSMFG